MTEKTCVSCGQPFAAKNPRRLTCSPECERGHRRAAEARCRQNCMRREKEIPEAKFCYRCQETLPAAAFGTNRWLKDGLQGMCKPCRREYDRSPGQIEKNRERKAAWYLLHHEEQSRKQKERYNTDSEFRAHHRAQGKAHYYADPRAWVDRVRERRQEQRRIERDGARRCICGRALPAETEEGPWFCRPRCQAECIRQILGSGSLGALLWRLRSASDGQRLSPAEERLIHGIAHQTANLWRGRGSAVSDEDLMGAAYLGAWSGWLSYEEGKGCSLKTWLITGARREVLDALRAADVLTQKERRAYREALAADPKTPVPRRVMSLEAVINEDPDGDALTVFDRLAGEEESADAVLDRIAAQETAAQILNVFPPSQARLVEVVRLVGMEGMTFEQVGYRLGISPSRVSHLWQRAKAQIQEAVSP